MLRRKTEKPATSIHQSTSVEFFFLTVDSKV